MKIKRKNSNKKYSLGSITDEEIKECFEKNAIHIIEIPFTKNNFDNELGDGVITKINQFIKFSKRVYDKLIERNRYYILGLIKPTLQEPILVVQKEDDKFLYFKSFIDKNKKIIFIISVTEKIVTETKVMIIDKKIVEKNKEELVSASSYELDFKKVLKEAKNGKIAFFLCSQRMPAFAELTDSQRNNQTISGNLLLGYNKKRKNKEKSLKNILKELQSLSIDKKGKVDSFLLNFNKWNKEKVVTYQFGGNVYIGDKKNTNFIEAAQQYKKEYDWYFTKFYDKERYEKAEKDLKKTSKYFYVINKKIQSLKNITAVKMSAYQLYKQGIMTNIE